MKTLSLAAAAWILASGLAAAQEPPPAPLSRADVTFVIGWQDLHRAQPQQQPYSNDWLHGIFYDSAGAGWYWTADRASFRGSRVQGVHDPARLLHR
jgi:hypothetical protein